MKMKKSNIKNILIISVSVFLLRLVYFVQISESNAYLGYLPLKLDAFNIFVSALMVICIAFIIPVKIERPSDFFLLFYGVIVLLSCTIFSRTTVIIDQFGAIILFVILLIPALVVKKIHIFKYKLKIVGCFNPNILYYGLVAMIALAGIAAATRGISAGFDWDSMYDRRLEGRVRIGEGNLIAYLIEMAVNGFAPFLGYVGALRNKVFFLIFSISFSIFAFWLLGVKAAFLMTLIFVLMGFMTRRNKLQHLPAVVSYGIIFICLSALGEYAIYGFSEIAETFVRRAFVVQGVLQSYFYDLIANFNLNSFLFGLDKSYGRVTFYVGSQYLGNPDTNANTNAFLYSFATSGILGYIGAVLFVGLFFSILDKFFYSFKSKDIFFVAAVYALLLTEQAYTTAMVSSGVAVLTFIVWLIKSERQSSIKLMTISR
ncbi:hypothetical protein Pnap_3121 [Polaromonas naphthalenivorans CJ2]|uniref:O-antigen polymerase n=2 Tax=Polaromonas naphthalenivorans TaxID=216465 RepID=A1VRZ1_POLNA|nr:hypothetical protein Pnap_3121 [Polaromonas naphthalenivorans CJ2]